MSVTLHSSLNVTNTLGCTVKSTVTAERGLHRVATVIQNRDHNVKIKVSAGSCDLTHFGQSLGIFCSKPNDNEPLWYCISCPIPVQIKTKIGILFKLGSRHKLLAKTQLRPLSHCFIKRTLLHGQNHDGVWRC